MIISLLLNGARQPSAFYCWGRSAPGTVFLEWHTSQERTVRFSKIRFVSKFSCFRYGSFQGILSEVGVTSIPTISYLLLTNPGKEKSEAKLSALAVMGLGTAFFRVQVSRS